MKQRFLLFVLLITFFSLSGCTHLFFKPGNVFVEDPEVLSLSLQDIYFRSSDGTKLNGWFFRGARDHSRGIILVCHGNVENISTHVRLDLWLIREGFDLFIFDYRGYGRSEGEATVDGIQRDAEAALETLLAMPGMERRRVIIFGKSLGGAVAIHLVATTPYRDRIKGLVIESAFADYRMMAREKIAKTIVGWPLQYPISFLVNNDFSPLKFIREVSPVPVLILHGTDDPIIPVEHGRLLYREALEPKQYWELPGLGHVKSWTDEATRKLLLSYIESLR